MGGESIKEAAIITWFKNVGDTIEDDEMLLEVATDKEDSEVPSNVSGTIVEILFKENDVIKIGETIAIINTDLSTSDLVKKDSKAVSKTEKKEVKEVKEVPQKKTS